MRHEIDRSWARCPGVHGLSQIAKQMFGVLVACRLIQEGGNICKPSTPTRNRSFVNR